MMVYAFTGTPSSPADMEILSVEDCGDSVVVTALATSGHELALGTAWSTVTTPALAKPVEFEIDLVGPASASEQP